MIKKYLVFDEDSHEYDLVVTTEDSTTTYELFHSHSPVWSQGIQGTLAMKMVNDGDNIILDDKYAILDYSQSNYLRFLLNFENATDGNELNQKKYQVIENETFLEL